MKKLIFLLLLPFTLLGQKEVIVHITTDAWPSETRWVLHADSLYGTILGDVNYGHYTQQNTPHMDTLYIPDSLTNITFVIYDSYGDGIVSPGSYYVSICGDTIISYPVPSFTTGLYSNRTVPGCMPNGPPIGPCVPAVVNINLDQFQSETTWEIKDSTGSLLYAGGPYSQAPDYQPQFEPVCLPLEDLTFTIYDSYGDGLAGSLWGGSDGSYYVMQCGDTLVHGTVANFGTDSTHVFTSDTCIPPPPIPGCMDEDYLEFSPAATVNDSSCATLKILGCTDSTMFNYDSTANAMDYIDSCDYTLILHDLVGNGWVGSKLEIYQDDTTIFVMTSGSNQAFTIQLNAPESVKAKFFVNAQASNTTLECGFSLINPMGDTVLSVLPPFMQAFFVYQGVTYCGNECVEIVEGCTDSLAYNYDPLANTSLPCYYMPGCTSPAYLTYYTQGFVADIDNGSCDTLALFGCTDSTAFNYDSLANVSNGGCIPVVLGCMQPLAFNYNSLANTDDTCIAVVYGCMSSIALNYNPLANTDDGSCIGVVYGCTDTSAFNYSPLANCDDSSCIPIILGCINPIMFNYCDTCNTNDGSCIEILYGCTDSLMFNYNPLANVDNNTCIPFIYGCTDPSMLNYSPQANTEDFSCIPYIYGCTDSTALNYDSLANTDNGSCIEVVEGCMDQSAYNYNSLANVSDSLSCLFDAGCITGPGNPYWLNDPCYARVIDIDDYCCNNAWDGDCQSLYDYCLDGWTGTTFIREFRDQLIVYPNPAINQININKFVDIRVYNIIGDMIISEDNINVVDVSKIKSGMYNLQIMYKNKLINKRIIKQ